MPTDNRSSDANEKYDGHRRSGGRVKRQGKKQEIRRQVNELMRRAAKDWSGKRGRGD